MAELVYAVAPDVTDAELNALMAAAWAGGAHEEGFVARLHSHSLGYLCTYDGARLVGFVNLAWAGGVHAFLLDTTVHPAHQRRGIGRNLVRLSAEVARARGARWLHVDDEPRYEGFYLECGFRTTRAGLWRLESAG